MSGLTDAEREALVAVVPWSPDAMPQVEATVEQIIAARVTAALNEAADEILATDLAHRMESRKELAARHRAAAIVRGATPKPPAERGPQPCQ